MKAGLIYFALVFALGFLLGTIRTVLVADLSGSGRLIDVLIELPIMLAASWVLCGFVVRWFSVAATVRARLVMGGFAFAFLILAEGLVGLLLFSRTPLAQLALYREASYAVGLAAQLIFGLMPMLRLGCDREARQRSVSERRRAGEPFQ